MTKTKQILSLCENGKHYVCIFDGSKTNPYRVYYKWYDRASPFTYNHQKQSRARFRSAALCFVNWAARSSKTNMRAPCWAIWRGAGSTKAMWLRPHFVSLRMSIKDKCIRKFFARTL